MTEPGKTQDPAADATRDGEILGGNRGTLSGRDDDQRKAVGQDNPLEQGSRQGRERYKSSIDKDLPSDAHKPV